MTAFDHYLTQQLADPEFKAGYDRALTERLAMIPLGPRAEDTLRGQVTMYRLHYRYSWAEIGRQLNLPPRRIQQVWWQYKSDLLNRDSRTPGTPAHHYHHERFG